MLSRYIKLIVLVVFCSAGGPVVWSIVQHVQGNGARLAAYLAVPTPSEATPAVIGRALVPAGREGSFIADALFNGVRVRAVVDTGASLTVLRHQDALAVGLRPRPEDFKHSLQTANGTVKAAMAELDTVVIGGITERNLKIYILDGSSGLPYNLLGQNYLSRLRVVMNGREMELSQPERR